jgi:EmrB/QacA subfamily drug resistance transporter
VENREVSPRYKWVALGITTVGVLMFAIDTTIVILALPSILTDLNSNLVNMIWVLMSYILVSTIFLLALGRVADVYGRVRLFTLGLIIFTIGSFFCGFAGSDLQLIAARVLQGVGGGMLSVNSLAIITEAFPPWERGSAMGLNSVTFGTGSVIGPVVGGLILSTTSWRWIFWINVPIGIGGTIAAFLFLRELSQRRVGEKLDVFGTIAFSLSLFFLLFALTQGIELGWTSPPILGLFGAFIISLAVFVAWEGRSSHPALDLSLFENRLFDFSVIAAMLQSLAIFASQFLVVFYMQVVRGYSPLMAALFLLPLPVANAIVGPFSGRISDRIGARIPATAGLLVQSVALFWLSTLDATSSYLHLAAGLTLMGLGGGLFWSPNTSAAMGTAPTNRLGVAAGTLNTLRQTGMVASFALALAVAAASLPRDTMLQLFVGTSIHVGTSLMLAFVDGMQAALRVSIVVCLVAAAMSLVRGPQVAAKPALATQLGRSGDPKQGQNDKRQEVDQKVHNDGGDKALPPEVDQREDETGHADRSDAGRPLIAMAEREDPRGEQHGDDDAPSRGVESQDQVTAEDRLLGDGHHDHQEEGEDVFGRRTGGQEGGTRNRRG